MVVLSAAERRLSVFSIENDIGQDEGGELSKNGGRLEGWLTVDNCEFRWRLCSALFMHKTGKQFAFEVISTNGGETKSAFSNRLVLAAFSREQLSSWLCALHVDRQI